MKNLVTKLTLSGVSVLLASAALASDFQVSAPDAKDGRFAQAQFANVFGCTGGNVSPRIVWSGAPAGTKSFLVSMYDKAAPTGSGWWHWVVANIPATVTELPQGAGNDAAKLPVGALQTPTDNGQAGYGGPCPPVGKTHDYVITIKALKVDALPVPPTATAAMVGYMSNVNSLAQASVTVQAGR